MLLGPVAQPPSLSPPPILAPMIARASEDVVELVLELDVSLLDVEEVRSSALELLFGSSVFDDYSFAGVGWQSFSKDLMVEWQAARSNSSGRTSFSWGSGAREWGLVSVGASGTVIWGRLRGGLAVSAVRVGLRELEHDR